LGVKVERGSLHALYLASVSGIARLPGFLVPVLIAALFGAGRQTDAYFLAYSAALLVGGTLGQGIEVAIVPFVARATAASADLLGYLKRAGTEGAVVAGLTWAVVVPVLLFVSRHALRLDAFKYALFLAPLTICSCASGVYSGTLISQWRIAAASGSMLWRGVGALAGLALWPVGGGLGAVAAGLGVGELCRFLWLRRSVLQSAFSSQGDRIPMAPLRKAAGAQVLAGAAGCVAPFVERILAQTVGLGTISYLEYATRLLIIPTLLFDGGLAPLLLARWSNVIVERGSTPSTREVWRSVGKGMLLALGCATPLALLASPFVSLLLQHGRFTSADTAAVSALLRVLAVGFVVSMGAFLLERLYLASSRNRTLAALSLLRVGSRIALDASLLRSFGLLAFGIGYAGGEMLYLLALLAATWPRFPARRRPEQGFA
jgi:putative peptidoglycan lipid II flippase